MSHLYKNNSRQEDIRLMTWVVPLVLLLCASLMSVIIKRHTSSKVPVAETIVVTGMAVGADWTNDSNQQASGTIVDEPRATFVISRSTNQQPAVVTEAELRAQGKIR